MYLYTCTTIHSSSNVPPNEREPHTGIVQSTSLPETHSKKADDPQEVGHCKKQINFSKSSQKSPPRQPTVLVYGNFFYVIHLITRYPNCLVPENVQQEQINLSRNEQPPSVFSCLLSSPTKTVVPLQDLQKIRQSGWTIQSVGYAKSKSRGTGRYQTNP